MGFYRIETMPAGVLALIDWAFAGTGNWVERLGAVLFGCFSAHGIWFVCRRVATR